MRTRMAVTGLVACLLVGCEPSLPTPVIGPPPPAEGISAARAVEIAQAQGFHSEGPEIVVAITAGRCFDLQDVGCGGVGGTRWVWWVEFQGTYAGFPCGPVPPPPATLNCWPGTSKSVILDYLTGEWLTTSISRAALSGRRHHRRS